MKKDYDGFGLFVIGILVWLVAFAMSSNLDATGSESNHASGMVIHGTDDWKPKEFAKFFFESAGVQVSEEKIASLDIVPSGLFDGRLGRDKLVELGFKNAMQQQRIQEAIEALDANITHAPGRCQTLKISSIAPPLFKLPF